MRRALALVALVGLVVLAGCTGGGVSQSQLAKNATYDWSRPADASFDVTGGQYTAVLRVNGTKTLKLSTRGGFGDDQPVSTSAVQFRYPNGTVVNASAIDVSQSGSTTTVTLPAENGSFAYTGYASQRSVTLPTPVDGSYEVILPRGMRADLPIFSSVSPGGYSRTFEGGRDHLTWSHAPSGDVTVDFYLQRDLYIYGGVVGLLVLVAIGGVIYFRLKIRRLERAREEAGLDVERDR